MSQQNDKGSIALSPVFQKLNSPPSPRNKKFLVPALDGDRARVADHIIGSCANAEWSKLFLHPAEDPEPDEQPSTVDMSAFKGSPSTTKVPYSSSEPWSTSGDRDECESDSGDESDNESSGSGSDRADDSGSVADGSASSSSSSDEDDSTGRDDNSSDEECDSNSNCSSSSSESGSSYTSGSRSGSPANPPQQTFSIRETNFEQGGLKLRISATTARQSEEPKGPPAKESPPTPTPPPAQPPQPKSATPVNTPEKKPLPQSPSISRLRPRKKEEPKGVAAGSSQQVQQRATGKRGQEVLTHAAGPSSARNGQPEAAISQLAQELSGDALQEINQEDLAAILPDVSTPEGPNEDVAGPPFDGFEDVTTLAKNAEIPAAAAAASAAAPASVPSATAAAAQETAEGESSSEDNDMLPNTVVSDAIQRIDVDDDNTSCTDGGRRSGTRADSYSSDDEDEGSDMDAKSSRANTKMYSSRLLQQYEQNLLSQSDTQKGSSQSAGGSSETKAEQKESKSPRHRRSKVKKEEAAEEASAKTCPLEMDSYIPLDCCNVSNVSPDSGIQSVAGSPVHQSCSPASNQAPTSPQHSTSQSNYLPVSKEASPPLTEIKKRPGRPANNKLEKRARGRPRKEKSINESSPATRANVDAESPNCQARRGPGRPKKCEEGVASKKPVQNINKVKVEPVDLLPPKRSTKLSESKERMAKKSKERKDAKDDKSEKSMKENPPKKKRWRQKNVKALTIPFPIKDTLPETLPISINFKRSKSGRKHKRIFTGKNKSKLIKQGHKFTHNKVQPKKKLIAKKSAKGVAFKKLKKKKKNKEKPVDTRIEDPAFMTCLEELLHALSKCTISKSLSLPAPGENRLPSIFRTKKLLKRRKASERSKNSDKDSENEALPPKSPHSSAKEKSKRKAKKSAVEIPKRAEPNEQRLPLKKRHYHLPSQQQPNSEASQDQPSTPPATSTKSSQSSSQATSTKVEKTSGNSKASRNSIDEAIESCISRCAKDDSEPGKSESKKKIKSEAAAEKVPKTLPTPVSLLSKRAAALKATSQITATITNTPSAEEKEKEKEKEKTEESPKPALIKNEKEDADMDDVPLKDLMNKKNKKKINLALSKFPVVKLLDQSSILKKAVDAVKKKAKRRKAINRTGFPVKKKKKPKKIVDEPEVPKVLEVKKENAAATTEPREMKTRHREKEATPLPLKKSSKRKRESSVTDAADNVPLSQRVAKRIKAAPKEEDAASIADAPAEPEVVEPEGKNKQQPRWRKKYLVAGLFSDYYKENEQRKTTPAELSKARNCVYKREEHKHGLLPPPYHCGKFLRQRRVDFELPYDMWWLHQHNKLPGRDSEVPSWNYKKIRTNVYYDMKTPYMYEAHQACNCSLPQKPGQSPCGDDCINRMVYAECVSRLCPCKEKCTNQKIQKHDWAPGVEKFMTKEKGWGVKTKKCIKGGEFIMEYVGEVVSEKEFKNRMESRYSTDTHHYCLHLDGGLVIDGHRMGGECRFVNHSCEPNCEMQKWSVNGLFRMALFALRDIEAGEELGYDYNFSLFNAAEGQPCKCGSTNCRGVIGGKYQRVNPLLVDPKAKKKDGRKSKKSKLKRNGKLTDAQMRSQLFAPMKPMSHQQRCYAQEHHCFLLRNLEKLKRFREKLKKHATEQQEASLAASKHNPASTKADVFLAQLNALSTPRSVRTRRLAQAEDNPELNKVARLAYVFKDLFQAVTTAKNEAGDQLCLPFLNLPSKKKASLYFERIQEAIDLSMIDKNITSGTYTTVENFDHDFCRVFSNNMVFYGRSSELGVVAAKLKKIYNDAKQVILPQLEDILGEMPPASFYTEKNSIVNKVQTGTKKLTVENEEDIIRCICGLFMDEGLMIQCEKCLVWQHGDCVQADSSIEHYLCEQCNVRSVNRDILLNPVPEDAKKGEIYHISLMREELQLRIGDTVYVLRDIDRDDIADSSLPPQKHTYKTLKNAKPEDCDIFKIERLLIENGQRFAFGHHYLRPHETFHEPTRKFFPNEVMRIPLYEKVSFDLILDQCWVLDLPTYCKGRPVGAKEEHVYICEFRIDKTARLFTRLSNKTAKQSCCQFSMKSYAFESFETKLKPVRSYTPHPTDHHAPRPKSKAKDDDSSSCKMEASRGSQKRVAPLLPVVKIPPAVRRANQISRLNGVLLKLLDKQQCKQPLDASYLLEQNKRQRKKPVPLQSS